MTQGEMRQALGVVPEWRLIWSGAGEHFHETHILFQPAPASRQRI